MHVMVDLANNVLLMRQSSYLKDTPFYFGQESPVRQEAFQTKLTL